MTDRLQHRRPESVLVVIHTRARACLLLERVRPPGFWQSVTGSLHWGETPMDAARREVREETGIAPQGLVDARVSHTFTILPHWRPEYGADVVENTEHVWYLEIPDTCAVRLNPLEHTAYRWLPLDEAIGRVSSWTNREAFLTLRRESG